MARKACQERLHSPEREAGGQAGAAGRAIVVTLGLLALALLLASFPRAGRVSAQQGDNRLVMKQASLEVMVEGTDAAVERAAALAETFDAFVLRQRVWDGEERRYRYAEITFGVGGEDFEGLLRALATLGTVLDESASGDDISDEYLDLNSQLENLRETQSRVRTFLDQAGTISETLRVHQELQQIEDQIGELQGRANFLANRADAGSIQLSIVPFIPTPTPSPTATPTPTPTPTPLPTPEIWRPADTAKLAGVRLQDTAQSVGDFFLYRLVVCGPWLLFIGLVAFAGWRLYKRSRERVNG
jgi:hypothetical protein